MSPSSPKTSRRYLWLAAPTIIVPLAFFAALPWLKNQDDTVVYLTGGIASFIVVATSFVMAIFKDRAMDEWHRSAARFANQWGWLAGGGLLAVAFAFPAFRDVFVSAVGAVARARDTAAGIDAQTVHLAAIFGFMATIFVQAVCIAALNAMWRVRMSRAGA